MISFLLLYLQLLCQLSRHIHLLLSFSSVLTYFVMDTSLSNEAAIKPELPFTLKLSNPMLINLSEFCAITSIFFLLLNCSAFCIIKCPSYFFHVMKKHRGFDMFTTIV